MDKTPYRPVIRTQADLEELWHTLMGSHGHSRRSVWWILIDPDGRPLPQINEIEDAGEAPDVALRLAFAGVLRELADELRLPADTRIAFLYSRPGGAGLQPHDRQWAAALYDVTRRAGLRGQVVHVATNDDVVPIPLDELDAVS